jgi:transaldolase
VVNVTAMMTVDQECRVADALDPGTRAIISVFAGRIPDTGIDPVSVMARASKCSAAPQGRIALGRASIMRDM